MMITRLSTLQYNMLRMFVAEDKNYTIEQAQHFDQRPFRSMLMRRWIIYTPKNGFHVTREGRDAYRDFETHDISRKNPTLPLTAYFDPTAYGLRTPKPKAVVVKQHVTAPPPTPRHRGRRALAVVA